MGDQVFAPEDVTVVISAEEEFDAEDLATLGRIEEKLDQLVAGFSAALVAEKSVEQGRLAAVLVPPLAGAPLHKREDAAR